MNNGSMLIEEVMQSDQGNYSCTPYNVHGTKGSSGRIQLIVKEPPKFDLTPQPFYQSILGSSLQIPCSVLAPIGTSSLLIAWQRRDGKPLSKDRVHVVEGSLTINNLQQSDHGEYECVASNEVATLVTSTKIIVEDPKSDATFNSTSTYALGGLLVLILVIIVSICAIKVCNLRKRRRQETAYTMVASRFVDAEN